MYTISYVSALLAGVMLLMMSSCQMAAMAELICDGGALNNNSIISLAPITNLNRCDLDNAEFRNDDGQPAALYVSGCSVSSGSLIRVVFGNTIFSVVISSTQFQIDARLVFEGTPQSGAALTISHCQFDVQTLVFGDTIAIDLRLLHNIPRVWAISINSNTINIASRAQQQSENSMLAAVAYNPETLQSVTSFSNRLNLVANIISFNTTGVAYGLHCTAKFPLNPVFLITENIIYHIANDGGNVTAFFIDFPLSGALRFFTELAIKSNEVRRIRSFVHLTGQPIYFSLINNFHSHFAETISNITFNVSATVENSVDVEKNVFVSTYDSWNPKSSYGNPLLILWTPFVREVTHIDVRHNDFYASRYTKSPIQFTGATNLFANSVLNLHGNYFTTNQLTASSVFMSSFATAEPRTKDQGTVYVCSNTWPAVFVAATATLTAQTATSLQDTTTRTAVAPIDSVTLLVDSTDSPRNVSQSGGSCPVVVTTRQPSLSRLPSVFASVFVLALAIFGSLL